MSDDILVHNQRLKIAIQVECFFLDVLVVKLPKHSLTRQRGFGRTLFPIYLIDCKLVVQFFEIAIAPLHNPAVGLYDRSHFALNNVLLWFSKVCVPKGSPAMGIRVL